MMNTKKIAGEPSSSMALLVADDLYEAVCVMLHYRHSSNDDNWNNLSNAAMRFNAERQRETNKELGTQRTD